MRYLALVSLALASSLVLLLFTWADLTPRVDERFFFAADSPAYQEALKVARTFPGHELLVVTARAPSIEGEAYRDRVERLGKDLDALPHIQNVTSLASGPKDLKDARESPLWRRLILMPDVPGTHLLLTVDAPDASRVVGPVREVMRKHEREDFMLSLAGVPYVVDDIAKNLAGDFGTFSIAAVVMFALLTMLLFRSPAVLVGSLAACTVAALGTLLVQQLAGGRIGLLTANLITIGFTLTQSHIVFLTHNWRRLEEPDPRARVIGAVKLTLKASSWCMVAALFGFASLWWVDAQPLRELGYGGALATVMAIFAAYLVYPPFLFWARPRPLKSPAAPLRIPPKSIAALMLGAALACAAFIPYIDSDPSLLDYFDRDSEVWHSLAVVDPHGGSNPLNLTVQRADRAKLDTDESYQRLWKLQRTLQEDPAVGTVISLPVLLAEADRRPLAKLLPWNWLIELLERPSSKRVAKAFVTEDRTKTQFLLRMVEQDRRERRTEVIARLKAAAAAQGFEVLAAGGTYALQGRLADLVYDSLWEGLAGLLTVVAFIGFAVTRAWRGALAMLACTAAVPAVTLGAFGAFAIPLDIIATPGVNVAIGVAVDSMIHLGAAIRRNGDTPDGIAAATAEQAPGILSFSLVVLCGFAIFVFSSFPPTRRFGLAVMLGAAVASAMALWIYPALVRRR